MGRYLIADFVVEIQNKYEYTANLCAEYVYIGERATDFRVSVSDTEILKEKSLSDADFSDGYIESVCVYRKLCLILPQQKAMLLHGSAISCGERGIVFLAKSGVGKTTHTLLWAQVYPETVIINGDKPIVRFIDGVPYAYGTPWSGKERLGCNARVRITDLCFITRSIQNSVCPTEDCADMLIRQMLIPSEPILALKTLEMADTLIKSCKTVQINCNMSTSAAVTAHDFIFGGQNEA